MSRLLVAQRALTVPGWAKDALWRRAQAVQSLDLRFADNKSLTDAVTGASLVTFTRASSGTYVGSGGLIQTAATNEPRFDHNPTTGESLGLLVEEARTNLLLQSNGFDTIWTNTNSSETAASGTAPDGNNTAWELKDTVDGSNVTHSITQNISITSGTAYTYTAWMKAGTLGFGAISFPSAGFTTGIVCLFNLSTGASSVSSGTATASTTAYPNEWYRCSVTATATASVSTGLNIRIANSISTSTYQGTGNGTILIWGAQLEAGAFPTSYISTTAATVTRAADVASISNANLIPWLTSFDENTFYAELRGEPPKGLGGIIMEGLVSSAVGGATLSLNNTSTRFRSQQRTGPSRFDGGNNNGSLLTNTINRVALRASALGSQSGENGLLPTASTSPAQADWDPGSALSLGKRSTSSSVFLNGCIARLTYWPTRLSNSTLQAITQP